MRAIEQDATEDPKVRECAEVALFLAGAQPSIRRGLVESPPPQFWFGIDIKTGRYPFVTWRQLDINAETNESR